jgi:diguanylate cyclase (GGDEF)-like protein
MMPEIDGLELTKRLRAHPVFTAMPIILLTARGMTADKVVGLTTGADDYVVKPFDTLELIARIRTTLRRNQEYREISPLTALPGNSRIMREITDRIRTGADYAVCHVDIDRFKSVNDAYGFARGDEFIVALARSLQRALVDVGVPAAFLGHVGGDDFLVVCEPPQVRPLTERAVVDFEAAADRLYDKVDADRGYLEMVKRNGEVIQVNLVTLSIGVVQSTAVRRYADPREVISIASEMKTVAKGHNGSYVAIDRRGTDQV